MPGGLIGMAAGDSVRFSQFIASIIALEKPLGTKYVQCIGHSVALNWNNIAYRFLENPAHLDWLFLVEDDHIFPPDTLMRLLAHKKDIVSGIYLQRRVPFAPMMFERVDEKGLIYHRFLQKGDKGLIKVAACGGGCLLIRRKVLEKIPQPWWTYGNSIHPDSTNHDVNFCREATKAGFEIFVDLDLPIVHMTYIPVVPVRNEDGSWSTHLVHGPDNNIIVKAAESGD